MKNRKWWMRYMKPADDGTDGDSTGGTAEDRGDDFTPTDDGDEPTGAKKDTPPVKKDEPEVKKDEPAKKDEPEVKKDEPAKKDEADDDGKGKRKDSRIPLSRHQEILEKERERRQAIENELAQLRKGQQKAKVSEDIAQLESKAEKLEADHAKAVADGDTTKAAQLLREIRKTEREIITTTSRQEIEAAKNDAAEAVRYDLVVERMEEAYPQLRPGSDEFDKNLVAEILETKEAFELKGYAPSQALQKSIKLHVRPETKKQVDVTDVTPRVSKDDVDEKAKEEAEAKRKKDAVSKALDAAGKTPASTATVGMDSDKAGGTISAKDIMKMSQDDFAKLDEATLARLRGDEV